MEGLIQAIANALAAILEKIGVLGRSRRRIGIRADLELLHELERFPDFERSTFAHKSLVNRIDREVAALAGVDLRTKKPDIPWAAIAFAVIVASGFGYWTYVGRSSFL